MIKNQTYFLNRQMPKQSIKILSLALFCGALLSGCQTVNVKRQSLTMTITNERDSILTRNSLSEASLNVLSMTGRDIKACTERPEPCVGELKNIPEIIDEQLYSTASELFLAKSLELQSSSQCKDSLLKNAKSQKQLQSEEINRNYCLEQSLHMLDRSLRYSYSYLFKSKRAPQQRIFDNRLVQVRDFYNTALSSLLTTYMQRYQLDVVPKKLEIGNHVYHINFKNHPSLQRHSVEKLTSSYNLNFSGFRSINRRDGFGAEFVAVLAEDKNQNNEEIPQYLVDPEKYYKQGRPSNIQNTRFVSATVVAEPGKIKTLDDILYHSDMNLNVYDPLLHNQLTIHQTPYALAANFSAPYGLWLAENNLGKSAYLTLFDQDQRLSMPQLYMQEPYNPKKKVIVLIHGLASSPEAWIRLTNDIMGDPVLRENYQVWQVFYSTNMPIFESRFQIYHLLRQAFAQSSSPRHQIQDAVLIGHSMGGLISRLLLNDVPLDRVANQISDDRLVKKIKRIPVIAERLSIRDLPQIDRAIFISSPHRGTEYADRWFTLAARKIIKLPSTFLNAVHDISQMSELDLTDLSLLIRPDLIQNGPSDLSHKSRFIEVTQDIQPRQGMKFHSIMGNNSNSTDPNQMTDGIVPYTSSHLEGAISEKIIQGGHSIQETPEAVLELRRILKLHLDELKQKNTPAKKRAA